AGQPIVIEAHPLPDGVAIYVRVVEEHPGDLDAAGDQGPWGELAGEGGNVLQAVPTSRRGGAEPGLAGLRLVWSTDFQLPCEVGQVLAARLVHEYGPYVARAGYDRRAGDQRGRASAVARLRLAGTTIEQVCEPFADEARGDRVAHAVAA